MRGSLEAGRLNIDAAAPLRVSLRGARPRVVAEIDGATRDWRPRLQAIDPDLFHARDGASGMEIELRLRHSDEGVCRLFARLRNHGEKPLRVECVSPLFVGGDGTEVVLGAGSDRWAFFRNGYQSWSGTRVWPVNGIDRDPRGERLRLMSTDVRHRAAGRAGVFRSDLFSVLANRRSGEVLAAGFVTSVRAFSFVALRSLAAGGWEFEAGCDGDGIELAPGATFDCEELWLAAGYDAYQLLEAWASELGTRMVARVPESVPAGWCSWYEDFTRVSEDTVCRNIDVLSRLREEVPCEYVQIDDGYQRAIGDWIEANAKFPSGMEKLAQRIRGAGFQAGLWIAPFIARRESRLFQRHPEWFVRDGAGRVRAGVWNPNWGWWGSAHALDTTREDVLDWLRTLARTLVREWGYRILKLDFLFAAALPGVRADATATRAQALRSGLQAIRDGAGDDAFLIGCGCPLGPAVGLVDAMRIGPDVAPFWSRWFTRWIMRNMHGVATAHAVRSTLMRAFMHRRLWWNDPDCLMVRDERTRLGREERRTLATAIALTDGMFVISDRMDRISQAGLEMLRQARSLSGGRVRVDDLCTADPPRVLLSERAGECVVAVFNFADRPEACTADLGRLGLDDATVREVWTGAEMSIQGGWLDAGMLPAHAVRVVRIPRRPEG